MHRVFLRRNQSPWLVLIKIAQNKERPQVFAFTRITCEFTPAASHANGWFKPFPSEPDARRPTAPPMRGCIYANCVRLALLVCAALALAFGGGAAEIDRDSAFVGYTEKAGASSLDFKRFVITTSYGEVCDVDDARGVAPPRHALRLQAFGVGFVVTAIRHAHACHVCIRPPVFGSPMCLMLCCCLQIRITPRNDISPGIVGLIAAVRY
eukprot:213604-Chlamydomonas_euryale.AAC.38